MLANLKDVLVPAAKGKYCVGHFNVINLEMARGVIEAAEEADAPVIIGIEESQLSILPLDEFASFIIPMARKAKVPVVVHFDHGKTFDRCIEALKYGFTSVNLDCSTDSLENNAAKVSEMVKTAHAFGAAVEAELGHTPDTSETDTKENEYTDPVQAAEYVKKTGIDALGENPRDRRCCRCAAGPARRLGSLGPQHPPRDHKRHREDRHFHGHQYRMLPGRDPGRERRCPYDERHGPVRGARRQGRGRGEDQALQGRMNARRRSIRKSNQ